MQEISNNSRQQDIWIEALNWIIQFIIHILIHHSCATSRSDSSWIPNSIQKSTQFYILYSTQMCPTPSNFMWENVCKCILQFYTIQLKIFNHNWPLQLTYILSLWTTDHKCTQWIGRHAQTRPLVELDGIIEFHSNSIHCLSDTHANRFPFTPLNKIFQNHSKSTNSIPMLW